MTSARRISQQLASNKSKKIAVVLNVKGIDEPCLVIGAKTSQSGKHGSAKTALRLKNYFTRKVSEVIVSATEKIQSLKQHPLYSTGTAIVLNCDEEAKTAQLVDLTQNIIIAQYEDKPKSEQVEYECWDGTLYRLKD